MSNWGETRVRYLENASQTIATNLEILAEQMERGAIPAEVIVDLVKTEASNLRDAVNGLFPRRLEEE